MAPTSCCCSDSNFYIYVFIDFSSKTNLHKTGLSKNERQKTSWEYQQKKPTKKQKDQFQVNATGTLYSTE